MPNKVDPFKVTSFYANLVSLANSFDFSITSSLRSATHNSAVGGLPKSKHLRFLAVDCVLDNPTSDGINFKHEVNSLGLAWLDEGDHIHVQVRG